jgi:hypothetical protein
MLCKKKRALNVVPKKNVDLKHRSAQSLSLEKILQNTGKQPKNLWRVFFKSSTKTDNLVNSSKAQARLIPLPYPYLTWQYTSIYFIVSIVGTAKRC